MQTMCTVVYRQGPGGLEQWHHHGCKGGYIGTPAAAYEAAYKLKAAHPGWIVGVLEGRIIEVER